MSGSRGINYMEENMGRTRKLASFVCFFFTALLLCAANAPAQGLFGTISGVVTDPSGAVVPGVTVKVINVSTSVAMAVTTNQAGVYSATSLNPGVYNVQAEARGFNTAVVNGISLEVGGNPKIDLVLQGEVVPT